MDKRRYVAKPGFKADGDALRDGYKTRSSADDGPFGDDPKHKPTADSLMDETEANFQRMFGDDT